MKHSLADYSKRLLLARVRILTNYGFYGIMLLNMKFGLDEKCDTAYTTGDRICFSPNFMDELSDSELEFVLMHEIMHVALKHCYRGLNYNQNLFNIACDIVVNSNILKSKGMDERAITLSKWGVSMHQIKGEEGYKYTAEEVYELLKRNAKNIEFDSFDNHTKWQDSNKEAEEEIDSKILAIAKSNERAKENGKLYSDLPLGIERMVKELTDSQVNWRELLHEFIQEDINDYSFMPPDKRFDGPFFMPDYNVKDESVSGILFMVDTSGSISEEELSMIYSEIKGAIEEFNGRFNGYIGFFDAKVYDVISFDGVLDLKKLIPKGGGGTSFKEVFNYVKNHIEDYKYLIILTDGYSEYPKEELDIPLLWILTEEDTNPPYGIISRIKNNNS